MEDRGRKGGPWRIGNGEGKFSWWTSLDETISTVWLVRIRGSMMMVMSDDG